jgi:elongation factor Ts
MATVTAKQVKELRESTGAGMLDCKKALEANDCDFDKSVDFLREKGLGQAAKKIGRLASEGLVFSIISDDYKNSVLLEINSETDFVAKNNKFQDLVKSVASLIQKEKLTTIESLQTKSIDGMGFEEYINTAISKIGEKIVVRRFVNTICSNDDEITNTYVHVNGKVGVVLKAKTSNANTKVYELLKNISMHAAAMSPRFLRTTDVPQEEIDKEISFAKIELTKLNKPEKIWDKIIPGKIAKYKNDNSLLGQDYVMDNKFQIGTFIENFNKKENISLEIIDYTRFELGEGLEKKSENFADEVAEQLK